MTQVCVDLPESLTFLEETLIDPVPILVPRRNA